MMIKGKRLLKHSLLPKKIPRQKTLSWLNAEMLVMNELDQIEAVAFSVMEADTNLFMLEMMNRHESYRANIAMLALPTIINALIIDCGNELALEVVKRTINKLFG